MADETTTAPPETGSVAAPPPAPPPVPAAQPSGQEPKPEAKQDAPAAPSALAPQEPAAKPAEPQPPQPVEYKDFKLPEGVQAADPSLAAFQAEASKLGIPQDHAQALVAAMAPKIAEAQQQAWVQTKNDWHAQSMKLPEFANGRDKDTLTSIGRFFDDFVGPKESPSRKALVEALLTTGADNNPAIVGLIARAANAFTEGGRFVAGAPARQADTLAQMYPSMQKEA